MSSASGSTTAPTRSAEARAVGAAAGPVCTISYDTACLGWSGTPHPSLGFVGVRGFRAHRQPGSGARALERLGFARALPFPALAAALAHEAHGLEGHAAVDRLAHVVDRQPRRGDRHQGLHLHPGAGVRLHARLDRDARALGVGQQLDLDAVERQRVAERNPLVGALGGLDARDARRGQHVSLGDPALGDLREGLRGHAHLPARDADAARHGLVGHVHHPRAAPPVEVGKLIGHQLPSRSRSHSRRSAKTLSCSGSLKIS